MHFIYNLNNVQYIAIGQKLKILYPFLIFCVPEVTKLTLMLFLKALNGLIFFALLLMWISSTNTALSGIYLLLFTIQQVLS